MPGKSIALSNTCYPEIILGPIPNIYPFIVNDPGEGSQAKRRAHAVIIDHLTPPLTRADSHGVLAELETLVDEYFDASHLDSRRLKPLAKQILSLVESLNLDKEAETLEKSVQSVLDDGIRTKDILSQGTKEVSTTQMGDAIISKLK